MFFSCFFPGFFQRAFSYAFPLLFLKMFFLKLFLRFSLSVFFLSSFRLFLNVPAHLPTGTFYTKADTRWR
jgi:hypothetical protein